MAWLQIRVRSRHPEFAEEILLAHGAGAVSFIDAVDDPVLEPAPGETPLWQDTVALGLFAEDADLARIAAGLRELLPDGDTAEIGHELVEDRDWVRVWLKDCPPLRFGDRLWVVPHEKLGEVSQADAVILRLDPGLAFGTGTHPTTALCLEWLTQQDLHGKTVLDYGCGSGVLAIAALLLGAERAICVDIDPQALQATRDNAAANGVGARVTTLLPQDFVPAAADIVVANILANPLIRLAPLLASSIAAGGHIALAGLLDRQADEVRAAYAPWFDFDADQTREQWTRISARCRMPAIIAWHEIDARLATAGQPRPEHFAQLAQQGFDAVINLAMPTSPNFLADEDALCARHGMRYRHLPVPFDMPQREHVDTFRAAMRELSGRKVLVHCALNMRASAFVFLHRVLDLDAIPQVASQDLLAVWQPQGPWAALIHELVPGAPLSGPSYD
jgi:ribosomal protein L11 methyltransferase